MTPDSGKPPHRTLTSRVAAPVGSQKGVPTMLTVLQKRCQLKPIPPSGDQLPECESFPLDGCHQASGAA